MLIILKQGTRKKIIKFATTLCIDYGIEKGERQRETI